MKFVRMQFKLLIGLHLLMNLSDALDKYFKSISPRIRALIKDKTNEILNMSDNEALCNEEDKDSQLLKATQDFIDIKVDQRLDTFNKVKELQAKGIPILRISKNLGMSRNTVRSYFIQESLSPRIHPKSTNIELFTEYIVSRLNIKGYKIIDIIMEIKELGFNGSKTQAYHNINVIRNNFKISTPGFIDIQPEKIPYVKTLSSRKLAKYIGSSLTDIPDPDERIYLETLLDNISELKIIRKLVQIFKTMLKRGSGNIKRWIEFINHSKYKLSGIRTFANGLSRDIEAVTNGINMQWSNGAVEGHVNRVKSIKRQMYGRASFDLLRKKVILSQTG